MMDRVPLGAIRAFAAALVLTLLLFPFEALFGSPVFAASKDLPARVSAVYQISFGVFGDIGYFQFTSKVKGEDYTLKAEAKIDTSVFDYVGRMRSSGTLLSTVTRPANYTFRYEQDPLMGKKKARTLRIVFNDSGVEKVKFVPPDHPSRHVVPVTKGDLDNVLDPLSAVMALSFGDLVKPCNRKLSIFDGKQRFDLVFSPSGRSRVGAGGMICRVRYIPIAGHRKGEGEGHPVVNGDIEVVLRPVPNANIVVPYSVKVPTIVGTAVLTSKQIDITMPNRKRIALRD